MTYRVDVAKKMAEDFCLNKKILSGYLFYYIISFYPSFKWYKETTSDMILITLCIKQCCCFFVDILLIILLQKLLKSNVKNTQLKTNYFSV